MKFLNSPFTRTHQLRLPPLIPFLGVGYYRGLRCTGESWFRISVPAGSLVEVTIRFVHANGDLDLYLYLPTGVEIHRSISTSDSEHVRSGSGGGIHTVLVRGYGGAQNTFSMKVDIRAVG